MHSDHCSRLILNAQHVIQFNSVRIEQPYLLHSYHEYRYENQANIFQQLDVDANMEIFLFTPTRLLQNLQYNSDYTIYSKYIDVTYISMKS